MEDFIEKKPRLALVLILFFAIALLIAVYIECKAHNSDTNWDTIAITSKGIGYEKCCLS